MDTVAAVILRRAAKVELAPGSPVTDGSGWVAAVEGDLARRGWLLHPELRAAVAALPAGFRVAWADWLLAALDEQTGADRPMTPLYRSFPAPLPPEASLLTRLRVHLRAGLGLPCVLCEQEGTSTLLEPCGHVVCHECYPPSLYSGCPICGRALAPASETLSVEPASDELPPVSVRVLGLTTDRDALATTLRDELAARPHALSEGDRADLEVLVRATAPGRLDWLPDTVPARETLAVVVAWALHASALTPGYAQVVADARSRWQTATDAARALWAYSGGDPGLNLPATATEGPGEDHRPADEPAAPAPRVRVRSCRRARSVDF